jgi:Uma2 family endonuclease
MAAEHKPKRISVEEYFALERSGSDVCYEYVDGYVYMMAGGSLNHDAIKTNIQGLLWAFLRGKSCRVYSSDAKVQVNKQRYFHPDVTITCDSGDQGTIDVIRSPRVIFEVLSPGTQIKDRTWKMQNYLALSSLEEYILVDSQEIKIEMYRREANKWVYYTFGPGDHLDLVSIDFRFPVVEAYLGIHLEKATLEPFNEENEEEG